jgi:AAA+ ATPase superfamily predicted ATPase
MSLSPFVYGTTVRARAFTNREEEIKRLHSNLTGGINTSIISPRRWGKTSLVEKVTADIQAHTPGFKVVHLDLYSVNSEAAFLEAFAREVIKASSTQWQEWVQTAKEVFQNISPRLSFGVDPFNDFSLSFDWKEAAKNTDELLKLPEKIALNKKVRFIICIDEFQNLATWSDSLEFQKKLRAQWQRQQSVTYCLYGSKRHMMTEIMNNPSAPFYRFGDMMLLPKIKLDKWIAFIQDGFANTEKEIDVSTAHSIAALMKNHSWYVQQLAHYTWNATAHKAGIAELDRALEELIQANTPFYIREIEGLSSTQINLLRAIAHGETQLTGVSAMRNFALGTPRNVSKNITTLENQDMIHRPETGGYEFLDPAFELWFRSRFLKEDYRLV